MVRWVHRWTVALLLAATTGRPRAQFPSHPIPCRDDIARVAQKYFASPDAHAVEVGVFAGRFAANNLKYWRGMYYMVDYWGWRPADGYDKNYQEKSLNKRHYYMAYNNTRFAAPRVHLLRGLSVKVATRFRDASLDWVYIDALHTAKAVMADLNAWYPKVRPGGLVSGDDYGEVSNTQLVGTRRWRKVYGPHAQDMQWGVISAVNNFTRALGVQLFVTWMQDCYTWPAWYFVKPEV